MLSVIIPIGINSKESLLIRCIESIYCQSYVDFEIILVFNGFSENKYINIKENISSVFKKNKQIIRFYSIDEIGVSNARNFGIKKSNGNYITFIDSDDEIVQKFFEESIELAEKYDADIVTESSF